jgi:hypothetical protein
MLQLDCFLVTWAIPYSSGRMALSGPDLVASGPASNDFEYYISILKIESFALV